MKIKFSTPEKQFLVEQLQGYFNKELDQELAQFDGEFLLDFISEQMGAYFYNRGLQDAQTILNSKIDTITEAIDEIELPTEFSR
jgi:uncharacterized protein (DUF2164 family)